MGITTDLRRALEKKFYPYMIQRGFEIDLRHAPQFITFRRFKEGELNVCDIQWDKYGKPCLALNFGYDTIDRLFSAGTVDAADVLTSDAAVYGRLRARRSEWFTQERGLFSRLVLQQKYHSADIVVRDLMDLFSEVELYWAEKKIGRHLRLIRLL